MSPNLSRTIAVAAALTLAATAFLATLADPAQGTGASAERISVRGATIHGVDKPIRASAAGPINGRGTAKDKDNPRGKGVLTLFLPAGKVFITNKTVSLKANVNRGQCTATIFERGTFKIIGGTRQYAHATGSGTYTNRRKLVGSRTPSGACAGRNAPPEAVFSRVVLTGDASR
jgi:hypothetical protein